MLIRSVVQDEIDDDPDAAILRLLDELDEVAEVPKSGWTLVVSR
jgi:hypothetical protein